MIQKSIENCPVCSHPLTITKVYCEQCGTTLSGQFGITASRFNNLSEAQMDFLMAFIRCEGKFNRMEEELQLSYPTLRNRFNEILAAMGFDDNQASESKILTKSERIEILNKIDKGLLSPEQADLMLRGKSE